MSRLRMLPRLYLRRWKHCRAMWVIRDGSTDIGTGCGEHEVARAEEALSNYLSKRFKPPGVLPLAQLLIDEVVGAYLNEYVPHSRSKEFIVVVLAPVMRWWTGKMLADITGGNCREYVRWRTAQPVRYAHSPKRVSSETARKELSGLRAAVNWYDREYGPLPSVPKFTLPEKGLGASIIG